MSYVLLLIPNVFAIDSLHSAFDFLSFAVYFVDFAMGFLEFAMDFLGSSVAAVWRIREDLNNG